MKILHIESATDICSIAISNGDEVLAFCEAAEPMTHSAVITILIEEALSKAGLEPNQLAAISLSKGPGSYTSLRVGASVAKGLCYGLQIPLIAVDTLESLAMAAAELADSEALYCPMIDARRMEVYTALYDANGHVLKPLESLIIDEQSYAEFADRKQKITFIGNGAEKCRSVLISPYFHFYPMQCSALHIIKIANQYFIDKNFSNPIFFSPEYVKKPNITSPKSIF